MQEALALVDDEGLEALSMRRLAARLGVEAASLYYWFSSKSAIVDGVVEAIRAEAFVADFDRSMTWQDALRFVAARYRAVLARHPNALAVMARPITTERGMTYADTVIGFLREKGLDVVRANLALTAVVAYVIGSSLGDTRNANTAPGAPQPSVEDLVALGLLLGKAGAGVSTVDLVLTDHRRYCFELSKPFTKRLRPVADALGVGITG